MSQSTERYISGLTILEQKVLDIAKSHLESSFDLDRSIGYLDFVKINTLQDNKTITKEPPSTIDKTTVIITKKKKRKLKVMK